MSLRKKLKSLSLRQILLNYTFSKKFYSIFLYKCCKQLKIYTYRGNLALECLKYGEFNNKFKLVFLIPYLFPVSGDSIVLNCLRIFNSTDLYYIAYITYRCSVDILILKPKRRFFSRKKDWTKEILLNMIDKDLSELEKIMIFD